MKRASTFPLAFASLALLAAACGSTTDGVVVADEASAVTVAGADSAIEEQGDSRPIEETDSASVVSIIVDLPEGANLAGTAIIALEDVTFADAEATQIASTELSVDQLVAQESTVEVFLPLPLDGSIDITATVHIDVDENGAFSQGDWISPEIAPVTPETAAGITVKMVQI